MANPKRRHSKARTRSRRSTWKLALPGTTLCPQCREPKLSHRVCRSCGHYDGRAVVAVKSEE